mmetsp:Transcript_731/g.851  ORF Transcript_731/g.851 Transcript_731/m.851 type:complete len:2199 (+) Transcript_731:210-6806(+)
MSRARRSTRSEKNAPVAVTASSRRSARSNKFSSSMKEPSESVADLLRKNDNGKSTEESLSQPRTPDPKKNRKQKIGNKVKSPVVRHTRARRQMKIQIQSEQSESESESSKDDYEQEDDDERSTSTFEDEEEESDIKIQRIIAVRCETMRKWKEICKNMETSEIEQGSRWFQESDNDSEEDDEKFEERFLVKWADLSFLHCSWEAKEDLMEQVEGAKTYLTTFFRKSVNGYLYSADDRLDGDYFDPSFVQIDRILETNMPESMQQEKRAVGKRKSVADKDNKEKWGIIFDKNHPDYESELGRQFLIKWGSRLYSESTYEYERDLILMDVEYDSYAQDFLHRNKKPTKSAMKKNFQAEDEERRRLYKIFGDRIQDSKQKEEEIDAYKKKLEEITYKNGGRLRDYQAEGVSWLLANHVNKRSAILADEMGLGKTIQTAAYVNTVNTILCNRGPFLIVAPLSTIPHWYREFTGWTDLNTVIYHGSAQDREVIREYEFAFECDRPQDGVGMNQKYLKKCHKRSATRAEKIWMAQVVITTPEMLVTDDFNELMEVTWDILVVDEAHRLKNHSSKLALNLRSDGFHFNHTLLLTGTPIQNNMNELWTLMNTIAPKQFESCDEFMNLYGNMKSKESVDCLHEVIRPYILRRLKEDVEKSVPPKEETLIEVELTLLQKQYYRALYEKNVQFLHRDLKKALDGPSINNLAMQLRKCCNHPFLLKGVEEKAKEGKVYESTKEEADFLAKSSGKLVLLDKLLPKLKEGGHRVLIFSQFKIMLDILEDYLALRSFKFERIDGSITGKKRQMAIDRYQSKASMESSFIMLLSTRAGGVGINLTAADTCIIFDSDWNPQNDLQAQARCHRIGQTKSVKIYRLLTRKTYEMQMFHMSSLKMGLDQAVLQGIENSTGNEGQTLSKQEVEKLLRCGAYDIFREEQSGASEKESNDFIEQDIDSILARRAKTVVHENTGSKSNAAGGTFSKASFNAKAGASAPGKDVDIDDPDFWKKMVGEVQVEDDLIVKSGKKRVRKKAVYDESQFNSAYDKQIFMSDDNDEDYDSKSESSIDSDSEEIACNEECEFNLSSGSTLVNPLLSTWLTEKRNELALDERKRWGGTTLFEWNTEDVNLLLRLMQRFGYCSVNWDVFLDFFRKEASKAYADEEVKRMCWSSSLLTLQETVLTDVKDTAKRIERAARKKEIESGSDAPVTDVEDVQSENWKKKQLDLSFNKFWEPHKWAHDALKDAIVFSKTKVPRDKTMFNDVKRDVQLNSKTHLLDSFLQNVWPALKTRGWKEGDPADPKKTWSTQNGHEYRYVVEILDVLPHLHPELSDTVTSVISSSYNKFKSSIQHNNITAPSDQNEIKNDKVDFKSLETFLQKYGSIQLIIDRKRRRSIALQRKNLEVFTFLRNAHLLVERVKSIPDADSVSVVEYYLRLSTLLSVHPKASLPHPSWKPIHDAILVSAIAKHGWINKESHCRAITNDKDIIWGAPFDEGDVEIPGSRNADKKCPQSDSEKIDEQEIKRVAHRAVNFLNNSETDVKGLNLNLMLKSYNIVNITTTDDDGLAHQRWSVDPAMIGSSQVNASGDSENHDAYAELPTRKDLLKRAKTILSKATEIAKSSNDDIMKTPQILAHNFVVLDQSNICNLFLAELIREVLKQNQKQFKFAKEMLKLALVEAICRQQDTSNVSERADFTRLCEHIVLVQSSMKGSLSRPAKNVLRVILRLDPVPPFKAGDETFLVESKELNPASKAKPEEGGGNSKLSHHKKVNESAAGDLAINQAISVAKYRIKHDIHTDDDNFLGVTTIETLILSVMCSQGLPIFNDIWEVTMKNDVDEELDEGNFLITWCHMGNVLEVAAEKWVEISEINFARAQRKSGVTPELERELQSRNEAYKEAMRLHQKPMNLAKKTIMLIEAIRLRIGTIESKRKGKNGIKPEQGIGARVHQWNKNHLVQWSKSLNVFDDGKPMSTTVASINPDAVSAAFLDKKNCKAVYMQIAQQTRLRSLFLKYEEDELARMVTKAVKNVMHGGDVWEGQPSWWKASSESTDDDHDLLSGVLQFGYGGFDQMLKENDHFCNEIQNGKSDTRLYRAMAQKRVNCMTRELSGMDDSTEALRLLNERKNNENRGVGGTDRSSTSRGSSIQVGINAFFMPKANSTTENVIEINSDGNSVDDSDSVAVVGVVSPKRKEVESTDDSDASSKRRKTQIDLK